MFFVTSIQFVACALRENLSNRSSGVQITRDICTRFGRYLYSTKCSWIINVIWAHTRVHGAASELLLFSFPSRLTRVAPQTLVLQANLDQKMRWEEIGREQRQANSDTRQVYLNHTAENEGICGK